MRSPAVSAWGTLVFEVMSQQTPIARVQPVWLAWMERWPEVGDVATASAADILVAWDRLGYPSRALRLRKCAQAVCEHYEGHMPSSYEELLSLPGIGPYTASAVASFHFHLPVPVLDTNIRRVLGRVFVGVERPQSSAPRREELELAASLLPDDGDEAAAWNVSVMEFGALVCTARSARCEVCPLLDVCQWRDAGYPLSKVKRSTQAWVGTDRQARGLVMKLLRDRHRASDSAARHASYEEILAAATLAEAEPDQAVRVVEGLVKDGLICRVGTDTFSLP